MTSLEKALVYLCAVQFVLLIVAFLWIMVLRRGWVTTVTFNVMPDDRKQPVSPK